MSNSSSLGRDRLAQSLLDEVSALSRSMRSLDLPGGLTRERLSIMGMLEERGRVSLTELASLANVRAPTMSRMASSMVEDGFAKKSSHKEDGRGILISLTAKGKRALKSANRKSVEYLRETLAQLSASEVTALSELVNKLEESRANRG